MPSANTALRQRRPRRRPPNRHGPIGMDRKTIAARAAHPARAAFPFSLLLGLAPLGAFVLLLGPSVSMALWAAFAAAFTLGLKDFLDTGRIRPFDAVNVALFAAGALGAG